MGKCSLQKESAIILSARSILYYWLQKKLQSSQALKLVTVEKTIPDAASKTLPRPIDCYTETNNGLKIAYWIFAQGIRRLQERVEMPGIFDSAAIIANWVFLSSMLKYKTDCSDRVLLSPTEREFTFSSKYDQPYSFNGCSLHYLDIEDSILTTLRGVTLHHYPQEFHFAKSLCNQIDVILIDPETGEFVHPGEHENLQRHKQMREAQAEAEAKREREYQRKQQMLRQQIFKKRTYKHKHVAQHSVPAKKSTPKPSQSTPERPSDIFIPPDEITCERCGCKSKEWSSLNPDYCPDCIGKDV